MTLAETLEWGSAPSGACRLWIGPAKTTGYATFLWCGKKILAHRAAWISAHGPIPVGLCVCHRCDVRSCVNPDHLFLGTHRDNAQDREAKGRGDQPVGEKSGMSKLTADAVREIRKMRGRYADIARQFNVHASLIGQVKRHAIWKHI